LCVWIYVDDIAGGHNNLQWFNQFKAFLDEKFSIQDLGKLKFLLGIEITETSEHVRLSQEKYLAELLHRFDMHDCKPQDLPLDPNFEIKVAVVTDETRKQTKDLPYRNLVGALFWISRCTRPDISAAVGILSKYNNDFEIRHWNALLGVLAYLRTTSHLGEGKQVVLLRRRHF
jgi:hypothetical protein